MCDTIKKIEEVRFSGVINSRGRLVAGGMKEGLESLENERESKTNYMELALRVKMRKEFDKQLGPVNFALASRQKCLEMTFPIKNDDLLYVFAEPDSDYSILPLKIISIVNEQ